MTKHAAIIKLSYELLAQLLDLPEGAQVKGVYQDLNDQLHEQFQIKVEHPDLPIVAEGATIPEVTIEYRAVQARAFVKWEQEEP